MDESQPSVDLGKGIEITWLGFQKASQRVYLFFEPRDMAIVMEENGVFESGG